MIFNWAIPRAKGKYNNNKVVRDGIKFDSELEYQCYLWLTRWTKNIQLHKPFTLTVNGKKICVLKPDFYIKEKIVVDAKGTKGTAQIGDNESWKYTRGGTFTPEAKLKYKLFEAIYSTRIYLYPAESCLIARELDRL